MSELTLGRIGVTNSPIRPNDWVEAGGEATLRGVLVGADDDETEALRLQAIGYPHPGESWVPLASDDRPELDGLYQVLGVDVPLEDASPRILEPTWRLRRAPAGRPLFVGERSHGGVITNAHSITAGSVTPWIAVPDAAAAFHLGSDATAATVRSGVTDLVFRAPGAQLCFDASSRYVLPEPDWYSGAAELLVGGFLTVGEQTLDAPTDWEISNGLIRVKPNASHLLTIETHNGSAWEPATPQKFDVGYWTDTPFGAGAWVPTFPASALHVLRNSPVECAVRLVVPFAPVTDAAQVVTVDVSIRRGSRFARIVIKSGYSTRWGLTIGSSGGATADSTHGIRRSADDANGNRWFAYCAQANSRELTDRRIVLTSPATAASFFAGQVIDYASASAPDDLASLKAQGFAGDSTEIVEVSAA